MKEKKKAVKIIQVEINHQVAKDIKEAAKAEKLTATEIKKTAVGLPKSLIITLEIRSTFLATLNQITPLPEIPIASQFDIPIQLSRWGCAIILLQPFVYR